MILLLGFKTQTHGTQKDESSLGKELQHLQLQLRLQVEFLPALTQQLTLIFPDKATPLPSQAQRGGQI